MTVTGDLMWWKMGKNYRQWTVYIQGGRHHHLLEGLCNHEQDPDNDGKENEDPKDQVIIVLLFGLLISNLFSMNRPWRAEVRLTLSRLRGLHHCWDLETGRDKAKCQWLSSYLPLHWQYWQRQQGPLHWLLCGWMHCLDLRVWEGGAGTGAWGRLALWSESTPGAIKEKWLLSESFMIWEHWLLINESVLTEGVRTP